MTDCALCNSVGGPLAVCVTCGLRKKPIGRSAPLEMAGSLCDQECPGYPRQPRPGELWPGERYGDSLGHMDWHDAYVRAAPRSASDGEGERDGRKEARGGERSNLPSDIDRCRALPPEVEELEGLLREALPALDQAVASARRVGGPDSAEGVVNLARRIRVRLGDEGEGPTVDPGDGDEGIDTA